MRQKLIFILILLCLVLVFVIQNASLIEIHFLFWKFYMSRALLLFLLLAVGIIIGWVLNGYSRHRKKHRYL